MAKKDDAATFTERDLERIAEKSRQLAAAAAKKAAEQAKRTGGQVNAGTGRVERGRIPRGSTEEPATFRDGPLRVFRKRK